MTDRDHALEPFDALVGTWDTQATHPAVDAVVPGRTTFEWVEGGHFLVQRSHHDHELFPDAISVIGAPVRRLARRRGVAVLAPRARVRPALFGHVGARHVRGAVGAGPHTGGLAGRPQGDVPPPRGLRQAIAAE